MSGFLYNGAVGGQPSGKSAQGGFIAQGTEILGKGVSEEQTTVGKITVANGVVDTPANIIVARAAAVSAGKNGHGLSR